VHTFAIKAKLSMDPVTAYRELSMLQDAGIIEPVTLHDGVRRYSLIPERGHRHRVVCTSCKAVEEVAMPCDVLHAMERRIGRKKKFQIERHSLEFYGRCGSCRSSR
jgi:Fur family ferric uptake transcriptional regulator